MIFFSKRVFIIIFILFILLYKHDIYCQINSWNHTHYTTKEGLNSNDVANVVQDKNGFIWIGTKSGLCRYDGDEFVPVLHDEKDSTSIPVDIINQIRIAPSGLLLVATFKGLFVMDISTQHGYTIHSFITKGLESLDDNFKSIEILKDIKKIVVTTSTAFIYFNYDLKKEKTIAYKIPDKALSLSESITNYPPIYLKNGDVIFMDHFEGRYSFVDYLQNSIRPFKELISHPYSALPETGEDIVEMDYFENIWFHMAGKDSLYCCKPYRDLIAYPLRGKSKNLNWVNKILFPNKQEMIWAYDESGKSILYKLPYQFLLEHPGCDIEINRAAGFSAGIHSIFVDRNKNWWIGSRNGVFLVRSNSTFLDKIELPTPFKFEAGWQHVSDIKPVYKSQILITTSYEHCYLYDIKKNRIQSYLDTAGYQFGYKYWMSEILSLQNDRKLILGYQDFSFYSNKLTKGFTPTNEFEKLFKIYATNCFLIDSKGNTWISFEGYGLVKWNPTLNLIKYFKPQKDFNSSNITSIAEDKNGSMWFVNYAKSDLWKLNINSELFEKEEIPDKWHSKFKWINNIVAGDNHILYLSTRQGIIIYNIITKSTREINMINGLPSNLIEALHYYQNHLYASTQNGLAIINANDYSIQVLNNTNGINEDITTRGFYIDTLLNTLFLGGKACVYKIDLSNFFSNINLPKVVIAQLKLNNKIVPMGNLEYIFKPFENNLSLLLSSIDFNSGQNKQYFYLLTVNGKRSIWTKNIGKQLNLLNLSPGSYTLQIKSKNSKNQWSSNTAFVKFEILTPWYNRWWFYLICFLVLSCVVYGIYLNKINQLKKLHDIRNRLSRDLHDDMGSTLSSINILSRTAQSNLSQLHNVKTNESLEKINDRSQRLLNSMNDIIWSINPHNDTLEEVMSRMREFATTILEAKNIEYTFNFPKSKPNCILSMDIKNNIYLIFKEAVNNSSKYANPTLVTLSLIHNEKNMHLTVEDNGKGFNETALSHIRGLNNMRHRAKEINAKLEIKSIFGEGTKISLFVPIHS